MSVCVCVCADLFSMGGAHDNRKDVEHRKKSLLRLKYTKIVDRLENALINFVDAI